MLRAIRMAVIAAAPALRVSVVASQATRLTVPPADAVAAAEFSTVASVRELSDGRVLVTDREDRRLAIVDWATGAVATIGRTGEGPGEYQVPYRLLPLSGDSTLLTDSQSRRWFVLDGSRIVTTIDASSPLNENLGPDLFGADHEGRVLGLEGYRWNRLSPVQDILTADSLVALIAHVFSASIDTAARLRGRGEPWESLVSVRGAPQRSVRDPLPEADQALLFPDGWLVVVRVDPYRVDWITAEGHAIQGAPLPFVSVRVDRTEQCAALERQPRRELRFECQPEEVRSWPRVLPPFLPGALLALPNGSVAIERTPSARQSFRQYDIVDRSGVLAATLSAAANEKIVGFGIRSVYTVTVDANDVQRLQRHPWPPR